MNSKYKIRLIIIAILVVINGMLLTHYQLWTMSKKEDFLAISTNGCINVIYSDEQELSLLNPKALADEDGNTTIPNTLTVTNNCKSSENISLYLDVYNDSTINDGKMKVSVNGDYDLNIINLNGLDNLLINSNINNTYRIISFDLTSGETKRINFRIWLDENAALSPEKNIFHAKYYVTSDKKMSFAENVINANEVENINNNYYIKGNSENNNVKFADKNWKIIAVNNDKSIKLMYDGNDLESSYNKIFSQERNVSFEDSTIKEYLDKWYEDNISSYDSYVLEHAYCNDSTFNRTYIYTYGSYTRVFDQGTPSIECQKPVAEYGGEKNYKVGLITLDEAAIIGGNKTDDNYDYYLNNGENYYTMSPAIYNGRAYVGVVTASGKLDASIVTQPNKVRPVINVIGNISVNGDGTSSNPYIIQQ